MEMKDEQSRYEGRRSFLRCLNRGKKYESRWKRKRCAAQLAYYAAFYAKLRGLLPDRMGQDPCSVYRYSAKHAAAFFAGQ